MKHRLDTRPCTRLCTRVPHFAGAAMLGGLLAAAGLASAQSAGSSTPATVEVRAVAAPAAVRHDVQNLCPQLLQQVPDALAKLHAERGEVAVVEVAFALNSGRVGAVQARGGPAAYQRALKRLVRQATCTNEATAPTSPTLAQAPAPAPAPAPAQELRFRVQFVDPATARALAGVTGSGGASTVLTVGASAAPLSGAR